MRGAELKYSCRARWGLIPVVSPGNSVLKLIEFSLLKLRRGENVSIEHPGKELVLLLLSGRLTARTEAGAWELGPRKDVFSELPWALYSSGFKRLSLIARSKAEAVISAAPCKDKEPVAKLTQPTEVTNRTVGQDTYERQVRTVIGEDFPARLLLVGETINQAGKWSSYPPHRHEKDAPPHEAKLEEVYYYRTEKANGFGLQRIYTDDGRIDQTHTVREGDVCVLPRGYHPVSAAPSSRLYYFWALAGKNRKTQVRVDPDFS